MRDFNINSQHILNRTVVLDSTLIGIVENEGQYFRAEVKLKGSKNILRNKNAVRRLLIHIAGQNQILLLLPPKFHE